MVAYVGPTEITQDQLDDAVAGVTATLQAGQQVSRQAVVNAMIHGALAEQIAAANDIAVTDSERDTVMKGSELVGLLAVPAARPIAYDLADQRSWPKGRRRGLSGGDQRASGDPESAVRRARPAQKLILPEQSGSLAQAAAADPLTTAWPVRPRGRSPSWSAWSR